MTYKSCFFCEVGWWEYNVLGRSLNGEKVIGHSTIFLGHHSVNKATYGWAGGVMRVKSTFNLSAHCVTNGLTDGWMDSWTNE